MVPAYPLSYQRLLIADTRKLIEWSRALREQACEIVALAQAVRETIGEDRNEPRQVRRARERRDAEGRLTV